MVPAVLRKTVEVESLQDDFTSGGWPSGEGAAGALSDSSAALGIGRRLGQMMAALRRNRQENFPGILASETYWAVVLQLYAAHVDQHRLNIGMLTKRAAVPATTVLRAISALEAVGFVIRSEDRFDRRRVVVELSSAGVAAMNNYLQSAASRGAFL